MMDCTLVASVIRIRSEVKTLGQTEKRETLDK